MLYNATSKALSIHGALVWLTTVAAPSLIVFVSCPTDSGIVALNDSTYLGHATVADLDCAPVEYNYCVVWSLLGSACLLTSETLSDPGCDVLDVWWVEPGDLSRMFPF